MAVSFTYDNDNHLIRGVMTDRFDASRFKSVMTEIASGTNFAPATAAIWDMREFDFHHFDSELAQNISNIKGKLSSRQGALVAYIVPNDLGYGLMRMFQLMSDTEHESMVFLDYDKGLEWLILKVKEQQDK
ncbi:MAG: hypothetical protein D6B25_14155 [Desulfobulbaceae bacterium]|nr:MAG: hypothetical protein D6B25_14155 [Desulfobulbaceae bacterium]